MVSLALRQHTTWRVTLTCSVIALLALLSVLYRKAHIMVIDPLLGSGLSESELRMYRYLFALQYLSRYEPLVAATARTAEEARAFMAANSAVMCIVCGRWFLAEMVQCPFHSVQTRHVSHNELEDQVIAWEHFRKRLSETSHINITRVIAIRLHYFLDHVEER